MQITFVYQPFHNGDDVVTAEEGAQRLSKEVEITPENPLSMAMAALAANKIAHWSTTENRVIGNYSESLTIEDGGVYNIISSDVRKTIEAMK